MTDTAITAQEVINDTISRRKDTDKTVWGDTELLVYLNKAIDNIGMMLIYLESPLAVKEATITLVAGTQEYVLTDENLPDFWAMSREGVYFPDVDCPLTAVVYSAKIRNTDTTTLTYPTKFYITADSLGVIPIPTLGTDLKCRYFMKPAVLTLTSSLPYGNLFNASISMFIDSLAALKDDMDMTAYQTARETLEALVLRIVKFRNPVGPKGLVNR